ncbi:MAG TPA: 6-phosphogluconolactonase [Nocardioides sp.]|nr:6-phosphogluconolactonase [Nocardioides sp.]
MTRAAPEVVVLPDADALARHVADRLLRVLEQAQAGGRAPAVALTGGTIADRVHAALAGAALDSAVDWAHVDVWWGDERFVPAGDPERNALQARRALLDLLPLDPARVHEVAASDSGVGDVAAAAVAYSDELREHGRGRFDVVMLGVGPDGHVASLFPGSPQLDVDDQVAVAVDDSPKPPPQRVSLTYGALNRTAEVWFLVSGEGKAEAVARALGGADLHEVPATGVRGEEHTVWLLDEAAASDL